MYYYQRHRNDASKYTLETICNAIDFPPAPQPWEDFLDFSRMKFPNDFWTIQCRVHKNCFACRFKGNYIAIWMFAIVFAGAFVDRWYWISLGILFGVWILTCIFTVDPEYAYIQSRGIDLKKQKLKGIENERVSSWLQVAPCKMRHCNRKSKCGFLNNFFTNEQHLTSACINCSYIFEV